MLKRIVRSLRPALVLLAVFLVLGFAMIAYQGVRTLQQLTAVEAERDQWQRPSDIIYALDPRTGNTVVDLGCGSGYFALKLVCCRARRDRVGGGDPPLTTELLVDPDHSQTSAQHSDDSWRGRESSSSFRNRRCRSHRKYLSRIG